MPNKNKFGFRRDGTPKGNGWFGVLKRPDGGVSTEITVGVDIYGKEVDIPTLVPTLSKEEIDYLLKSKPTPEIFESPMGRRILEKAHGHAIERIVKGLSPFAD